MDLTTGSNLQPISNPIILMIPCVDTFIFKEIEMHESPPCTVYERTHGSRVGNLDSVALSAYGAGVA